MRFFIKVTAIVPLIFDVTTSVSHAQSCTQPEKQFIPNDSALPDQYGFLRIDPEGRYILVSSDTAYILDRQNQGAVTETRLNRELTAASGDKWEILSSANHKGNMEYLNWREVLEKPNGAKPFFKDPQLNKQYHFSAEIGKNVGGKTVRTLTYPPSLFRDLELELDEQGRVRATKAGEIRKVCKNLDRLLKPSLSMDGLEVAGTVLEKGKKVTKIFSLSKDGECTEVENLGYDAGKVVFSFSDNGHPGYLAFIAPEIINDEEIMNRTFIYSRKTRRTAAIGDPEDRGVLLGGFTKSSEYVYIASDAKGEKDFVISNKVEAFLGNCGEGLASPSQLGQGG
jgi:hypothetical protein